MECKSPQPTIGDAYAFPLDDGRFAVCRILQSNGGNVLVACSSWIGTAVPDCIDTALRDILRLTHHAHRGQFLIHWVPERLPEDLIPIGRIEPTDEETQMHCGSHGYWDSITCQPLRQWNWDHDREASDAADESEKRQRDQMADDQAQRRIAYLRSLTLEELASETPFPNWTGHVDTQTVRRGRRIIRETVKKLIRTGRHGSNPEKIAIMTNCMAQLADLSIQHIDTESRYEVFADIEAMTHACGIPEQLDQIYSKRNW